MLPVVVVVVVRRRLLVHLVHILVGVGEARSSRLRPRRRHTQQPNGALRVRRQLPFGPLAKAVIVMIGPLMSAHLAMMMVLSYFIDRSSRMSTSIITNDQRL